MSEYEKAVIYGFIEKNWVEFVGHVKDHTGLLQRAAEDLADKIVEELSN